jgi:RNA polymerase sigma-70 factor (ECF subfamily)
MCLEAGRLHATLLGSVNACRGSRKLSVSVVPPLVDCLADLSDLRRFGVALARDDRFVLDHASAATLVDRLFRQASLEAVDASVRRDTDRAREDARVRAFGQFVRLHRRHVRRLTLDDGEQVWDENAESLRAKASAGGIGMAAAVRTLPLELREALLMVVLAGFTHREAASALDISLATLITRLTKARERVAALTHSPAAAGAGPGAVSHLRVVK